MRQLSFFSYRQWLTFSTLFYLLLPFLLFLIGWIRPILGVPACLFLLICGCQALKRGNRISIISPPGSWLLIILLITLFSCIRAGMGEWTPQSSDFIKHNLVLADLVKNPWPVRYAQESGQPFLCYYLAYYLPIALMAKLLGVNTVPILSFIWSAGGLYLFFNWVLFIGGQYRWGAILGFTLLSGLRVVNHFIIYSIDWLNRTYFNNTIKLYFYETTDLQAINFSNQDVITFSHNIIHWLYTPQQALGGWLAVVWLYSLLHHKQFGLAFFIPALTLFYSPFAVIGFSVLLIAYWPQNWRAFVSVPNMLGTSIICSFLVSYYLAHYPLNANGWVLPNTGGKVIHDLNLIFTDLILPLSIVWWLQRRFRVFTAQQFMFMVLVSVMKLLCMFFYVGYNSDLLQRLMISLSSLFFILLGIALQKAAQDSQYRLKIGLLFIVFVSLAFRPLQIVFMEWPYAFSNRQKLLTKVSYLTNRYGSINELNGAVFGSYKTYDRKDQYLGRNQTFFGRFLIKPPINSK